MDAFVVRTKQPPILVLSDEERAAAEAEAAARLSQRSNQQTIETALRQAWGIDTKTIARVSSKVRLLVLIH